MSEDSLEGGNVTVEATTSEPVQDTKDIAVESEATETTDVTETEGVEEAEVVVKEVKELSKADKIKVQMQKRIDRQTASSKAKDERNRQLEAQVAELTPKNVDNSPKEDDYADWEEYQEAVVDYKADERVNAKLLEQKEQELKVVHQKQMEESRKVFTARENELKASKPDYTEKSEQFIEVATDLISKLGADNQTLEAINQTLLGNEMAPRLIYELGSNPDLIEDLANMSPVQAQRELFKMEMGFSTVAKPEQSLPAPIKSLKGKGQASKGLDKMSQKDLMAFVSG